ncbi:F-box domain-containing protein [Caenorhabditis elegans]|uniref:F-box domain-containing protein n=2 Tax=Caenorhabditis elegans TaxID=6239 RepID=G4RXG5_CAEEL|nr:F-box domain-containing protein [Caenorhabditis elegans]CCD63674.1 F-box domain-containing protein [Caenorhabditis elegans]|eukprot:NP_001040733.1 F-box A protein [Caenorhabditis elegans]
MSLSFRENKFVIRAFILYEALDKKPIQESYDNFCKKVGNDVMTQYDFDFWFYRFYHGNHDLLYDRSADPVPKSLPNMPLNIISEILAHLDIMDLLVMMKVSRNLRSVVQAKVDVVDSIGVRFFEGKNAKIVYNDRFIITYEPKGGGCTVIYFDSYVNEDDYFLEEYDERSNKKEIFVPGKDYLELFNKDLKCLLENRKIQLETIEFTFGTGKELCEKCMNGIVEALKSAKSLTSRTVRIWPFSFSELAQLVAFFPAETLEEIYFAGEKDTGFEQLVSLDQWKNARKFDADGKLSVPIEHFLHFEWFEVCLATFTESDAMKIRDMIDRSTHFGHAEIRSKDMNISELMRVFAAHNQNQNFAYETPDKRFFNVKIYSYLFRITKLSYRYDYNDWL